jgi:hypothetical protein
MVWWACALPLSAALHTNAAASEAPPPGAHTHSRPPTRARRTEYAKKANEGKPLPLWQKAACGLTAGGLGALVGTPADLTLVRMQVRCVCVCVCVCVSVCLCGGAVAV